MLIYQSSIKARVTDYRVNNQTKGKSIHQCNSKQRTPSQQQPIEFAEMKKDQRYRLVISVNNVWLYKRAEKEDRGGEKSCFRRGDTPYPQGTYPTLRRKPHIDRAILFNKTSSFSGRNVYSVTLPSQRFIAILWLTLVTHRDIVFELN